MALWFLTFFSVSLDCHIIQLQAEKIGAEKDALYNEVMTEITIFG